MKVYEALASAVALEGTEVVFTLMDSFTEDLMVEISEKHGIRTVTTRHEQGAVLMADGYARATGKPGVCVIGAGPALAQTGTGAGDSSHSSVSRDSHRGGHPNHRP